MTTTTTGQMWDKLIELGVSEETLKIVANGWGNNRETLETVLFVHAGYRTFDQVEGEAGEDY